jgi:hypothetical protein
MSLIDVYPFRPFGAEFSTAKQGEQAAAQGKTCGAPGLIGRAAFGL